MAASHPSAYRPDIDGLRAVAVILVVLFHAGCEFVPGGFVGVDVFFVISGYLITGILLNQLEKKQFGILDFYARRVRRILPALLIVLATCYAVGWLTLLPDALRQLGKHMAGGAGFAANLVLWNETGYFDAAAEAKPLLHLWSLGIEEQFYIVWPLLLYAIWGRRSRVALAVIAILIGSLGLSVWKTGIDPAQAFYSPLSRAWELAAGSLLVVIGRGRTDQAPLPNWIGAVCCAAGLALIGAAVVLLSNSSKFPGWWALLPTTGAFLIIAAGPANIVSRVVLSNPIMVGVGLISFPLYLWHWPLLSFARIVESGTPPWQTRAVLVVASVVLAWLTYILVERPIRSGSWKKPLAVPLVGVLAIFGGVGVATYLEGGFASRYPAAIQSIADYKYDFRADARIPECWLSDKAAFDGFTRQCFATDPAKRRILIWGDSHAARLYPGLLSELGKDAAISQTTRDSCPPIVGMGYENCAKGNAYIMSKLATLQPDTVLLFAAWGRYGVDWKTSAQARTFMRETVAAIRKAGVKQVIVLGPAPEWSDDLPKLVYHSWASDYPSHRIPQRLTAHLVPATQAADAAFRDLVPASGATLYPVFDKLCNQQGCLTHIPGAPDELTTWDYGHLTTPGAKLVARGVSDLVDH